jgi:hypothetical protein
MASDDVWFYEQHLQRTLLVLTSNLTSGQKIMKLILLWLDSDQGLNIKDIEDFLFFPMGIHASSYYKWFRRYVSLELMNAAGILR